MRLCWVFADPVTHVGPNSLASIFSSTVAVPDTVKTLIHGTESDYCSSQSEPEPLPKLIWIDSGHSLTFFVRFITLNIIRFTFTLNFARFTSPGS